MLQIDLSTFPELQTERLILRQLRITDSDAIFALRSDDEVNKYIGRKKAASVDDAIAHIQKISEVTQSNEAVFWAITFKGEDKLIGTILYWNIDKANHIAEIGYELLPEYQGRGIMQEALAAVIAYGFNQLKIKTIEAYTIPANERSLSLLNKFGFEKKPNPRGDSPEVIYALSADR
ncbi:GNAT family protein [Mucilaginibacter gynuensis]|uniref:GNAT family protein n=1 Tax=Mucilaginibacter gynuensis TaxID=1302236 RepID=A0ABP8HKA2_9SPHI